MSNAYKLNSTNINRGKYMDSTIVALLGAPKLHSVTNRPNKKYGIRKCYATRWHSQIKWSNIETSFEMNLFEALFNCSNSFSNFRFAEHRHHHHRTIHFRWNALIVLNG